MPAPIETHLEVVAGDDYKTADGRALVWGPSQYWPNLASATLSMVVAARSTPPVTWTGGVPSSPPSPSTVHLDVTSAQTVGLSSGTYDYMLTAVLANRDRVTLASGQLTVLAAPGTIPLHPPAV